jgi:uncharacterized membrane protein (Fun14 family)
MPEKGRPALSATHLLLIVVGLTVLVLLVMTGIAVAGINNDASKSLVDTCETAFKMGFGAIIGLNGGKHFG